MQMPLLCIWVVSLTELLIIGPHWHHGILEMASSATYLHASQSPWSGTMLRPIHLRYRLWVGRNSLIDTQRPSLSLVEVFL